MGLEVILKGIVLCLVSYLCGSIPTSVWVSRTVYGRDIRKEGSGNAGATNVLRTFGWKPALAVALVDVLKGWFPVAVISQLAWFTGHLENDGVLLSQILAGFCAVLGHVWTVFAGFKGGKGVATAAGMLIALFPLAIPVCLAVFVMVFLVTRTVSLGSMSSAFALPITLFVFQGFGIREVPTLLLGFSVFIPLFILWTHRSNISRLLKGNETPLKKKGDNE